MPTQVELATDTFGVFWGVQKKPLFSQRHGSPGCQKMSGLLWPFDTSHLATLFFTKNSALENLPRSKQCLLRKS